MHFLGVFAVPGSAEPVLLSGYMSVYVIMIF
jgi:hypothetical protein